MRACVLACARACVLLMLCSAAFAVFTYFKLAAVLHFICTCNRISPDTATELTAEQERCSHPVDPSAGGYVSLSSEK
eukprot:SAG31_NODE_3577_length_4103_cov_2.362637_5_plen_77_part_00